MRWTATGSRRLDDLTLEDVAEAEDGDEVEAESGDDAAEEATGTSRAWRRVSEERTSRGTSPRSSSGWSRSTGPSCRSSPT